VPILRERTEYRKLGWVFSEKAAETNFTCREKGTTETSIGSNTDAGVDIGMDDRVGPVPIL
jgi:hypothetical protein